MKKWIKQIVKFSRRILAMPIFLLWLVLFPITEFCGWLVNLITGEDIVE